MKRKLKLSKPIFPETRDMGRVGGNALDKIMMAVGFSGAEEAFRDGRCYVTFPSRDSVESFYRFLFRISRKPRALRLDPAT